MAKILDYPKVQQTDATHWRLLEEFQYRIGNEHTGDLIVVPEGFITDFASIPRLFWNILPPFGKYSPAAVIHDYLYNRRLYSRKKCDQVFLEAMTVMKVVWWKRQTMYWAVRVFG